MSIYVVSLEKSRLESLNFWGSSLTQARNPLPDILGLVPALEGNQFQDAEK